MRLFYTGLLAVNFFLFVDCAATSRSHVHKECATPSKEAKATVNHSVSPREQTKFTTIEIHSQENFNSLPKQIKRAVSDGYDAINVNITKGTYTFDEGHLTLLGFRNINISIEGNGSLFYGNGIQTCDNFSPDYAYLSDGQAKTFWSEVVQSAELIEVVDKQKNLCRIKKAAGVKVEKGDYIQISQWFRCPIYEVSEVKDGFIYFVATDLEYILTKLGWSVNYDHLYGGEEPRYRIFPHHSQSSVFLSDVVNFINVSNFSGSLSIRGLHFVGSAYSSWKGVIRISASHQLQASIVDCTFEGCRNPCVNIQNCSNVTVQNCVFQNNYQGCVIADDNCCNIAVCDNTFRGNGLGWTNSFNISLSGTDFIIKSNKLIDFHYGGIGVGCWWNRDLNNLVTGDVYNNELYDTPEFYASFMQHSLMDGGAIYVLTQTDGVTIRNNYIHDISGMKDNRGIFCDDGAKNVTITGNVIQRIQNSYCIDLRKVTYVAEKVPDHNTGNTCTDNLVDGDIRFYLRDESCTESNNKKFGDRGYKTMKAYRNWRRKIK